MPTGSAGFKRLSSSSQPEKPLKTGYSGHLTGTWHTPKSPSIAVLAPVAPLHANCGLFLFRRAQAGLKDSNALASVPMAFGQQPFELNNLSAASSRLPKNLEPFLPVSCTQSCTQRIVFLRFQAPSSRQGASPRWIFAVHLGRANLRMCRRLRLAL